MEKLSEITKFIPLGSFLIILCSSLKLIVYYKVFNIDIVDYLDLQEYITLFIEDLFAYSLIFGFGIIIHIGIPIDSEKNKDDLKSNYFGIKLILGLLLLTFLVLYILWSTNQSKRVLPFTSFGFDIAALILVIILFVLYYSNRFNISYASLIIALLFVYLMVGSIRNAFFIIENKDKLKYTIVIEGETIRTGDNLHLIGKSSRYIFLHDVNKRSSIVLKRDNISEIKIDPK